MQYTSFDTYGMAYEGREYVRFDAQLLRPADAAADLAAGSVEREFIDSVMAVSAPSAEGAGAGAARIPRFEEVMLDIDAGLERAANASAIGFASSVDTTALFLENVTTVRQQQMYDYMVTRSSPALAFYPEALLPSYSDAPLAAPADAPGNASAAAELAAVRVPFYIEGGAVARGFYVNASFVRPAEALGTVALPPLPYADLYTIYTGINYATTEYGDFITDTIYQQLGNTVMTAQQAERREIVIQMVVQLRFGLPIRYTTASMQAGLWTKQYIATLLEIPVDAIKVMLPSGGDSDPSGRSRRARLLLQESPSGAERAGLENGTVVLSLGDDVNAQVRIATFLVEEHRVAERSVRGSIGVIVGRGPGSNLVVDRMQVADISSAAVVGIMRNVAMINMTDPRAQTVAAGSGGGGAGADAGAGALDGGIAVRYRSLYVMSRQSLQYMLEAETALATIIGAAAMLITGVLLWGCCFQMPKAKVRKRKHAKGDLFGDFGSDEYEEDGEEGAAGGAFGFGAAGGSSEAAYFGESLHSDDFMKGLALPNGGAGGEDEEGGVSYSNPLAVGMVNGGSSDDYYGTGMTL